MGKDPDTTYGPALEQAIKNAEDDVADLDTQIKDLMAKRAKVKRGLRSMRHTLDLAEPEPKRDKKETG